MWGGYWLSRGSWIKSAYRRGLGGGVGVQKLVVLRTSTYDALLHSTLPGMKQETFRLRTELGQSQSSCCAHKMNGLCLRFMYDTRLEKAALTHHRLRSSFP